MSAWFDAAGTNGMGLATVTKRGIAAFCFSGLPFTPHNVTVTIDYKNTSTGMATGQVDVEPPGGRAASCNAGENVEVAMANPNINSVLAASFYITFN